MSSPAHILPAHQTASHRALRYFGRWIGWAAVSMLLTVSCYCVAGAYALDSIGADGREAVAAVYSPSQWQVDELASLER